MQCEVAAATGVSCLQNCSMCRYAQGIMGCLKCQVSAVNVQLIEAGSANNYRRLPERVAYAYWQPKSCVALVLPLVKEPVSVRRLRWWLETATEKI